MGLFLLDTLHDALLELDAMREMMSTTNNNPTKLFQLLSTMLEDQDKIERDKFYLMPRHPEQGGNGYKGIEENDMDVIFKGHSICHTALFPSQARYDGLVTGGGLSEMVIQTTMAGFDNAVELNNLITTNDNIDVSSPLVFKSNNNKSNKCEDASGIIDRHDFFCVKEGHGWLSTIVPNDFEMRAYASPPSATAAAKSPMHQHQESLIAVCLRVCPAVGECPDQSIGFDKLRTNNLRMTVDDIPVVDVHPFDGCHLLVNHQGLRWAPGRNGNGQYELRFRIDEPGMGHWLGISSFIVVYVER